MAGDDKHPGASPQPGTSGPADQQNFLRTIMGDVLEKGTLGNPLKLGSVLDAVTSNLTVDDEWSSGDLRGLAFSMRGLRTNDVTFLSAPLATNRNQSISGEGDVVLLDTKQCSELWKAIANDKVSTYADAHRPTSYPATSPSTEAAH